MIQESRAQEFASCVICASDFYCMCWCDSILSRESQGVGYFTRPVSPVRTKPTEPGVRGHPCADDVKVRQAAWECLVRVATCYYEKLPPYMQDIFALSQRAVKQDEEAVALQAIEFWCTICEEELDKARQPGSTWEQIAARELCSAAGRETAGIRAVPHGVSVAFLQRASLHRFNQGPRL